MSQSLPTTIANPTHPLRTPKETVSRFLAIFSNRHSLLRAIRGCSMAVVTLLCGVAILVGVDWTNRLPETWRWLLTCSLYAITLVTVWRLGLKGIFFPPSLESVARYVEQSRPNLRESLLAAVELRRPDGTTRSGSPIFVDAIERNVALELNGLEIDTLLPWWTISKSLLSASGMLVVVLVACCIPDAKFAERLARAMIPFISFHPPSNIQYKLLEPSSIPLPKVLAFHSTVKPPSYSLSPTVSTSEPRGDLRVLKGSRVQLDIDVNQTLSQASIAIELNDSGRKEIIALRLVLPSASLPLVPNAIQRYASEFAVEEDATYQVRLISDSKYQGKQIENLYSPRYRIDALVDSPPLVSWLSNDKTIWTESPKPNQAFIVAPDEIINLSAIVSDNLPIEKLFHEASINRGHWFPVQPDLAHSNVAISESISRNENPLTKPFSARADWTWDLIGLAASSGDSIATRVTAIDRKGNSAHTPILQFSLATIGFDRDRHKGLYRRSELVLLLEALSVSLNKSRAQLRPQMEKLKDTNFPMDQRAKLIDEIRSMISVSAKAAQTTRTTAEQIMKELGRCIDQAEVELAVRLVTRIEKEWLATMSYCIDASMPQSNSNSKSDAQSAAWHQKDFEQKTNRLLQSYDMACDNSKRGFDIYRQFVGLELQASLTSDLTKLLEHQQSVLNRKPIADFIVLSRSQQIAQQYMDAIVKLATDMEPNLIPDFKNKLAELYRWIDQTRTETQDLAEQEQSQQATNQLRNRIDRSVSELKNVRWAFNLQGNLTWDAINGRKELLSRSGSLWPIFERFADRHNRRIEVNKDKSLATDDLLSRNEKLLGEVTGPLLSAIAQMLDHRDMHLRRSSTDSMYASDMGMAYRAWTRVLERWVAEPANASSHFTDAQLIAKAYRILESAHETVQARMLVQSLLPIEQYEWKSLEAQLINPKQWDSVNFRLEVANQWMREAGFPIQVADKFNALRLSHHSQNISNKLNPRREANNTNLVSSADEIRSLLLLWAEADRDAKPILDDARATLAKYSPTVSELAKQAAKATGKLKQLTKQLNPKSEASAKEENEGERDHSITSLDQMQLERERSEARTSQLQDALIELANKQDLLEKAELDAARDSDRSLKLLDAILPLMNAAIDEAMVAANENVAERNEKISEAVRRELSAITSLEKIANHFAMLEEQSKGVENSREIAQSSAELSKMGAESMRELALMPESLPLRDETDDYKKAEDLAELAKSDPESLLTKLEKELKRNPLMQQELSEISKSNAQSLAKELQNAAKTEESLARQLENSDAKLFGEKRLRLDQLKASADQAERFAARLLSKAAQAAQRAGSKEQSTAIEKASEELRRASQSARKLSDDTPRREIESVSQDLFDRFNATQKQVQSANEALQATVEQLADKDERKRQNMRKEEQNIQNQIRNELLQQAKEFATQSQRQNEQAAKRVKQSQVDLDNANKQRQSAKKNLVISPSNETALDSLRQASSNVEQAFRKKQVEEKVAAQAEELATHSREQVAEFEKADRASLDRPNPRAALAVEQLEIARKYLEKLQEQVKSVTEFVKQLPPPQTPASALSVEGREQQQIQENVLDVSVQLARSGRHEERLGNAQGAKDFVGLAVSVEQVARGTLDQASRELHLVVEETKQMERKQSDAAIAEDIHAPFVRPETNVAQDKMNSVAQELSTQAKQIEEQIGEMQADRPPSPVAKSSSDENTSVLRDMKQAEARDMARTLDVLDRQLNLNPGSRETQPHDADASTDNNPSKNNPATEQKSSRNQASKQAGADEDRNGARSALKDSVKASAEKLAGSMSQEWIAQRTANQSQNGARKESQGKQSRASRPGNDLSRLEKAGEFNLPGLTRVPSGDWGKLRNQRAEDAVEGRRDEFDPEFSEAIKAYFKALGNR